MSRRIIAISLLWLVSMFGIMLSVAHDAKKSDTQHYSDCRVHNIELRVLRDDHLHSGRRVIFGLSNHGPTCLISHFGLAMSAKSANSAFRLQPGREDLNAPGLRLQAGTTASAQLSYLPMQSTQTMCHPPATFRIYLSGYAKPFSKLVATSIKFQGICDSYAPYFGISSIWLK